MTISKVELHTDGDVVLTTDTGIVIDITPRVNLSTDNVVTNFPEGMDTHQAVCLVAAASFTYAADLADRVQRLEGRLGAMTEFLKNLSALGNAKASGEPVATQTVSGPAIQLDELTL